MKPALKPAIALALLAILYTGCGKKQSRYLFMPPAVTPMRPLSAGWDITVDQGGYIPYDSMVIRTLINVKPMNIAGRYFHTGNAAYATSFPDPDLVPVEKINRIQIRPVNTYNDGYAAYTDLAPVCDFYFPGHDTVDMQGAIELLNNPPDYFTGTSYFSIILKQPPSATSSQQFIVEMITDNNAKLADTTYPIMLTP